MQKIATISILMLALGGCQNPQYINGRKVIGTRWQNGHVVYILLERGGSGGNTKGFEGIGGGRQGGDVSAGDEIAVLAADKLRLRRWNPPLCPPIAAIHP